MAAAPSKPSASLTRAVTIGVSIGVAVAGIALMLVSLQTTAQEVDCSGPNANECLFQVALNQDFARWQLWIGVALELLAIGAFLWLRAADRKVARESAEQQPPV